MTAQCAIHMGALTIFGTPWLRPRPLFPIFSWAFVPVDPMNVPTKVEVRSFTRCWDNRGYPKNLGSPWIRPRSILATKSEGVGLVVRVISFQDFQHMWSQSIHQRLTSATYLFTASTWRATAVPPGAINRNLSTCWLPPLPGNGHSACRRRKNSTCVLRAHNCHARLVIVTKTDAILTSDACFVWLQQLRVTSLLWRRRHAIWRKR